MQKSNSIFKAFFALLIAGLLRSAGISQITDPNSSRVDIISTDVFEFKEVNGIKLQTLTGNVHLRQDTTDFYCDSATRFVDSNSVIAKSHVRVVFSDSMEIKSDKLTYDGNTKVCELFDHIILSKKNTTLKTDRLTFYRNENYGYYFNGGVIDNGENQLTSIKGYFYPDDNYAKFKHLVRLVNPKYTLTSDSLGYDTDLETAYFVAPTLVVDSLNTVYTERGYYDTQNGKAYFYQNAHMGDTTYTLYADTIFYDKESEFGRAKKNIRVEQADSGLTVYGNYGEFFSKQEMSFITDSAWAIQRMDDDTLYLFADTLRNTKDTIRDQKIFSAYKNATFFMNDMQGKADSLVYLYSDSTIRFFKDPVLWSDVNQISGDTISIYMKKGKVDSISIPSNAFIAVKEDTIGFNQIKGLKIFAKLDSNQIRRMWVFGNSESIYYAKDESGNYVGVNKSTCVNMRMWFKDNKPTRIVFLENPVGEFSPLWVRYGEKIELQGFEWREKERPEKPMQISDNQLINENLPAPESATPGNSEK